jgi:excinuclease ABC subunit C
MGQCLGACFREVPEAEYAAQIKKIKRFLDGNVAEAKRTLKKRMTEAAEKLQFELAADLRDQIRYIEQTVEKQRIISNDNTPRDLFTYYLDKGYLSVQIFFIRQARLIKREKRIFHSVNTPDEELATFILQFYNRKNQVLPKEVLVPAGVEKSVLSEILGIPFRTPQRGQKRQLLEMANENAKLALEEKFRLLELDNRQTVGAQEEIFKALGLPYGHVMEAFDHSHIQGSDPVSAMVYYEDGKPNKSMYRKYKLKGEVEHQNGANEAANTREVIRRRYSRLLKEKKPLPDLILMDGGEIELDAVKDVLVNELNLSIPVAGMVKNDKHQTADLLFGDPPRIIDLDRQSQGFFLLTRVQDEVHRFVITFHRRTHNKNSLASKLEAIHGVGPKTRIKLLKHFGSVTKIKEASVDDIESLGIAKTVAQTILLSL